ncbi:MAG: rhomboid family intramembrane serine protease [Polyangiaceae bacterium]|nr:rhomboid family intramembrane serine protease [Polyangiaceae bacterium]
MTRELLDRALSAFLTYAETSGEQAILVAYDTEAAWLVVEQTGEKVALWYGPDESGPVERAAAFKAFVKKHNREGSPIHFILAGDELSVRRAVREAKPTLMMTPLGFYHLDPQGKLFELGARSKWVEAAALLIPSAAPISVNQVRRALAHTQVVAAKEAQVAGKLKGRYGVTLAITIACVALFLLRFVWGDGGEHEHLQRMGVNYGPWVKEGQIWRLLASAFLHADVMHLAMNMVALWVFGTVLEGLLGPRRYLTLYAASALVGSLASALIPDPRPAVGASGAVWGLMTAGIAFVYRPQGLIPSHMVAAARARAWAPLALNLMYSFRPGVDFWAHIGGGIMGAGLFLTGAITSGLQPLDSAPVSRRDARGDGFLWTALGALSLFAMVGSIGVAIATGKPWAAGEPPIFERKNVGQSGVYFNLPKRLIENEKVEKETDFTRYTYGVPGDPVVVDIAIQPLDGDIPSDQLERELEEVRKQVESSREEGVEQKGPVAIETVAGRRAVVKRVRVTKSEVDVVIYQFVVGPRLVMLRTFVPPGRPKSWIGVETQIAESVRDN